MASSWPLQFGELAFVEDRYIEAVLRDLDRDLLAVALVAAGFRVKDKFLSNLPEREAIELQEVMAYLGPVRVLDILEAQRQIAERVQRAINGGWI